MPKHTDTNDQRTKLQELLTEWMGDKRTRTPEQVETLHIQLWCAVALECGEKKTMGIITRPLEDPRIKWACQWLDKQGGHSKAVCPNIEANARFHLGLPLTEGEPAVDYKSLAAGEH